MAKQAVILAAGGGGRTRPFTANRPKAMLCIGDKPIVQLVIEALRQNGIYNIILVVGHRKELIFDYIGSGDALGVNINYVTQPQQLGSADALLKTREYVDDDFLVLPGNKYLRAETLLPVINAIAPAILVKKVANPPRSSIIIIRDGIVKNGECSERRAVPAPEEKGIFTVDTRVYSFNRGIFDFLEDASSISAAINNMLNKGLSVTAVETESEWADLIYPWDILNVNGSVLKHIQPSTAGIISSYVSIRGDVVIKEGCVIHSNCSISGPVVIGQSCEIGSHVSINGPVSIGANAIIEPFTYISNCVIGSNVHIAPGSILLDSVIDDGTFIGSRFTVVNGESDIRIGKEYHRKKIGVMIGEGCQLGSGIITQPGTIIGNFCQVKDLKTLSGNIPDNSMVV